MIFPQKCGHWHFQNAVGRENPVKARPVDSILCLHRPRFRMTVSARFLRCLQKEKMRFERAGHQPLLSLLPTKNVNYTTMRAGSQWDTYEDGMPVGIRHTKKTFPNFPPAFLGNRHLRSKQGFIKRCEAPTGASRDPLPLKLTEYQALVSKAQMLFSCLCRSDTVLPNLLFQHFV